MDKRLTLLKSLVVKELDAVPKLATRQQDLIDEVIQIYSRDKFYAKHFSEDRPDVVKSLVKQAIVNIGQRIREANRKDVPKISTGSNLSTFQNSCHVVECVDFEEYSAKYTKIMSTVLPNKNLKIIAAHRLKGDNVHYKEEFNFSIKNLNSGTFRFIKLRLLSKSTQSNSEVQTNDGVTD